MESFDGSTLNAEQILETRERTVAAKTERRNVLRALRLVDARLHLPYVRTYVEGTYLMWQLCG